MHNERRLIIAFALALLLHALAALWLPLKLPPHDRFAAPLDKVEVRLQPPPVIVPPTPPKLKRQAEPRPEARHEARPAPQPAPSPPPVLAAKEPTLAGPVSPPPVPAARPAPAPASEPVSAPRFDAAYLNNPRPAYPMIARRNGDEGKVLLRVHVTAEGRAEDVRVHTTSGSPALDRAAREAVLAWRFVPARQGSQPVAAWVLVPIVFKLED